MQGNFNHSSEQENYVSLKFSISVEVFCARGTTNLLWRLLSCVFSPQKVYYTFPEHRKSIKILAHSLAPNVSLRLHSDLKQRFHLSDRICVPQSVSACSVGKKSGWMDQAVPLFSLLVVNHYARIQSNDQISTEDAHISFNISSQTVRAAHTTLLGRPTTLP